MNKYSVTENIDKISDSRFKLLKRINMENENDHISEFFYDELAPYCKNNKNGYIDKYGKIAISCIYKECFGFVDGIACVEDDKGFFFIDQKGERAIPDYFDEVCWPKNGIIRFKKNGLYGFCAIDGQIIKEAQYSNAGYFNEGFAAVEVEGKTGFIDIKGNLVIPQIYDPIKSIIRADCFFNDGCAAVGLNGRYGYIDKENEFIIKPQFLYASYLNKNIATIKDKSGTTAINSQGEKLFEPKNLRIGLFKNGLAGFVGTEDYTYYGVVRDDGFIILSYTDSDYSTIELQYDYLYMNCISGLIPFTCNDKWGFYNRDGIDIIPAKFESFSEFGMYEYATVRMGGHYGIIDKKGDFFIECSFRQPITYYGGDRLVFKDSGIIFIYEIKQ